MNGFLFQVEKLNLMHLFTKDQFIDSEIFLYLLGSLIEVNTLEAKPIFAKTAS